jgi:hypothetical protein
MFFTAGEFLFVSNEIDVARTADGVWPCASSSVEISKGVFGLSVIAPPAQSPALSSTAAGNFKAGSVGPAGSSGGEL